MDPISIAGLVCAIVSAFTGAASLFKERKASKKEKAEKEKGAAALRKSLAVAPPQVQREYDQDFSRIGQPFAIGDDIGRNQLSAILIDLQMKMIGTLQTLLNEGQGNYSSLLGTSDSSRLATISALGSQFQRLSQAAPIRGSIPVMTSRSCVLWNDTDQGVFNKDTKASRQDGMDKTMWKGSHCKVCAEADESNVWVQRRNRPELYKVPKQHLSRMHHMWKDTDQGMLNTFCKVQCGTGKYFTFKKGRRCTVFDINQRNATEVWVKFISSWEPNAGYRVPKSCLNPVYPGGYKGVPTSVYVP